MLDFFPYKTALMFDVQRFSLLYYYAQKASQLCSLMFT